MRADKRGIETTKTSFINWMGLAVVLAVLQHKPLYFAYLGDTEEPMGIFIVPDSEIRSSAESSSWVLTSWDDGGKGSHIAKFVSMQVTRSNACSSDARPLRLTTKAWINGVWDTTGCRKIAYIFPFSFLQS